jgi:hypothetical protein
LFATAAKLGHSSGERDVIEDGPQQSMKGVAVVSRVVVVQLIDRPQELGPVGLLCRDGRDHLGVDVGTSQGWN